MTEGAFSEPKRILSPKERRQRNRQEVIAAILDAARAVMREEGVAALNLQEVARRVGMRAPSLYTYFPSKTAIYEALFVMGIREFRIRLERIFEQHGYSWESLHASFVNREEFACEYPEFHQLVFERPVPGFVPSEEGIQEGLKLIEMSNRAMRGMIEAGLITPTISPEAATNLVIAMMHGLTAMHLANEPHLPAGSGRFGSLIPMALSLLKAGWGTNPAGRTSAPE